MSWPSDRRREWESDDSAIRDDDLRGDAERAAEPNNVDAHWSPVGRFHYVAEAGYFADELSQTLKTQVRVRSESSFDGMHHFWQTRYVLLAPHALKHQAEATLRDLIENGQPFEAPVESFSEREALQDEWREPRGNARASDDPRFELEEEDRGSGVHWVPILLTLTAGSAVFFGLRWWQEAGRIPARVPPVGGGPAELWDSISRSPAPWTQPRREGRGERRLRFDRQTNSAVIEEDIDGDGVPDQTVRFRGPERPRE